MFKNLTALKSDEHRQLRMDYNQPFSFASGQVLVPLTTAELFKAARDLVIVFPERPGVPQALLGVEAERNLYINETGHWMGRYIPSHLRRYPFMLAERPSAEGTEAEQGRQFTLCIEADAPHLQSPSGERLFTDAGEPTELLKIIQNILMGLQTDQEKTLMQVQELDEAGLLESRQIRIGEGEGDKSVLLSGFRTVDVKALQALDGDSLARLSASGALSMAYAHLVSLTNLEDGWIAKQIANEASNADNIDALFDGGADDTLNFNF